MRERISKKGYHLGKDPSKRNQDSLGSYFFLNSLQSDFFLHCVKKKNQFPLSLPAPSLSRNPSAICDPSLNWLIHPPSWNPPILDFWYIVLSWFSFYCSNSSSAGSSSFSQSRNKDFLMFPSWTLSSSHPAPRAFPTTATPSLPRSVCTDGF